MAKKESEKVMEDVHKLEKDISFYKTELMRDRPQEYVYEVRKLLVKAEEKKRHLVYVAQELARKEALAEKANKIKK